MNAPTARPMGRQKAPSAIRCIKTLTERVGLGTNGVSESTERHKVH